MEKSKTSVCNLPPFGDFATGVGGGGKEMTKDGGTHFEMQINHNCYSYRKFPSVLVSSSHFMSLLLSLPSAREGGALGFDSDF